MARTAAAKRTPETPAKKSKKRPTDGGGATVRKILTNERTTSLKKKTNPKASRKKTLAHKNARMSNFKTSLRKKIQKAPDKQKKPVKTKQKAKEPSNKAIVEKQPTNTEKGKSLKKQITTTFTLISSQVSISIQQNKTPPETSAKKAKNDTDLKHIVDSIERVVSNNDLVNDKKPSKKPNNKSKQRSRSPQRKRLASLNAMAKVHCLYESDVRCKKRTSDTESSEDEESSSNSSRSSSRQRAPAKKPPAKKKTVKKKPVKKRSSMEVSAVDLSELVTPKRMASLNAAAILAASSQHWSDRPRKKNNQIVDTESDSDREKNKALESTDDDVPLVKIKKQKKNEKITSSITSVRMIVQQQVEEGKTTTKSTFQATESSSEGTKSFQQHITCLKVSPTEDPAYTEQQQETTVEQKAIGPGSYSPLGALYNMRPPNGNADAEAPGASADAAPGQSSPAPRGVHVKERDKMWPPSADRLSGSSMPSVNFGGVPFMVNSHHPVQSVESFAGSARFAPSFSLYRPPIDIPYASLYPPAYPPPGAHFSPYYRGFALLPPPAPGFVPVALADSYSAYALAGSASADLSYYLHRYPPVAPPPPLPCGTLPRYLPTPCTLVDWRTEGNRPVIAEPPIAMHDDRNLLPLAGTEAAATSSANASSSTSSGPKLEAGSNPMPARNYCPLDVPVGSALVPPSGAAPASRCLPGSCSCAGQSTPQCPKNALAGPLTGEGKRSEPKSPSQSVIPHPSSLDELDDHPPNSGGSPHVPCLPPDLPCHGASETTSAAADDPTSEVEHNNNERQKRRLANVQPSVATRLRRRLDSANSDCTKDCCTTDDVAKDEKPKKKARKSEEKTQKPLKKFTKTLDVEESDSHSKVKEAKRGRSKSRSKSRSPITQLLSASPTSPRWSNGWSWLGNSYNSLIHLTNDDTQAMRRCFKAMKHKEGDVVRTRDCILLKSGPKAKDLPFVAKVSALWENAADGEMMMSLLWYYRPEHTDDGRKSCDLDDEIFASRHRDVCSVACIEDKCYVLTFNEYCRYRKQSKMLEEGFTNPSCGLVSPSSDLLLSDYPRRERLPPAGTPTDRVFLCRKVYDFRQKRILKNPA